MRRALAVACTCWMLACGPAAAGPLQVDRQPAPMGGWKPYRIVSDRAADAPASAGADNRVPNPGETVRFVVQLRNVGDAPLDGLDAEAAADGAWPAGCELLTAKAAWPALLPGSASEGSEAADGRGFVLRLPAALPGRTELALRLAVRSHGKVLIEERLVLLAEPVPEAAFDARVVEPSRSDAVEPKPGRVAFSLTAPAGLSRGRILWTRRSPGLWLSAPEIDLGDFAEPRTGEVGETLEYRLPWHLDHGAGRAGFVFRATTELGVYRWRKELDLPGQLPAPGCLELVCSRPVNLFVDRMPSGPILVELAGAPLPGGARSHVVPAGDYKVVVLREGGDRSAGIGVRLKVGGEALREGETITVGEKTCLQIDLAAGSDWSVIAELSPHELRLWVIPAPAGMVWLPGGDFSMGSEQGARHERPVHRVTLSPFLIDQTEVTRAQYAAFLAVHRAKPSHDGCDPDEPKGKDHTPAGWSDVAAAREPFRPVTGIDWFDAVAFAHWAGKRLLTEAEWEYAAAGSAASPFPWGDAPDAWNRASFDRQEEEPYPVAWLPGGRTAAGIYDLAGNVAELCADRYAPDAYERSKAIDPQGPEEEDLTFRVLRGGAYNHYLPFVFSSARQAVPGLLRAPELGFRCARSP